MIRWVRKPSNRHILHWYNLTWYEQYFLLAGLGIGVVVGFLFGWLI